MTDPTTPPATTPPAPTPESSVPYSRFQSVVTAKNELSGRVDVLAGEVQALTEKAATVDTLAGQLAEAQAQTAAASSRYQTFREIAGVIGVPDPDVVELVERTHGRLPAEGRPPIGDWLGTLQADPETAPAILRPFLTPPAVGPAPTAAAPAPRAPAPTSTAPGAPSAVSASAIRAARDEAVRSGDWTNYKALATVAGYRKA